MIKRRLLNEVASREDSLFFLFSLSKERGTPSEWSKRFKQKITQNRGKFRFTFFGVARCASNEVSSYEVTSIRRLRGATEPVHSFKEFFFD